MLVLLQLENTLVIIRGQLLLEVWVPTLEILILQISVKYKNLHNKFWVIGFINK